MHTKPASPTPTNRAPRAFTLAELLVAVSVVIVLSLAIGQVFSAVGKLVGAGAAVSEVDQLARGIERQMRDDFEAFGRLRSDETFFAIRSRTLGDANNNGTVEVGNGEISLYLTQNDKDTDLRAGVNAYQRSPTTGNQIGKGVTARLDEMVFLARASGKGKFASFQQGGIEGEPVLADTARVYYGHGLLPAPARNPNGSEFNPTIATSLSNRPVRRLFPDTRSVASPGNPGQDSAHAPTQRDLAWGRVFGEAFSRNEFATDFPLLRQPLLLFGGRAAGNAGSANQSAEINSTDGFRRRTYVPFIRDRENQTRSAFGVNANQRFDLANGWSYPDRTLSSPRMLRWGRTDICAQDRDDVQRWLEGLETSDNFALNDPLYDPTEASAYARGILEDSDTGATNAPPTWKLAGTDFSSPDAALMYRLPARWGIFGASNPPPDLTPGQAVQIASTRLRSAIAGVFSRMLCEPAQATVTTRINPTAGLASTAPVTNILDPVPADAAMDQHALLAPRCSSFEIAWSDGTTWNDPDPLNVYLGPSTAAANLIATYNRGDIVWFDSVFTRRQYRTVTQGVVPPVDTNDATAEPDPEVMGERTDPSYFATTVPASTKPSNPEEDRTASAEDDRLLNVLPLAYSNNQFNDAAYDPYRSGGDPTEYMAIWGFRRPAVTVESLGVNASDQRMALTWSQSQWEKPKYIRVRMTLHDSLNRIAGGKSYEFVFSLDPAAN